MTHITDQGVEHVRRTNDPAITMPLSLPQNSDWPTTSMPEGHVTKLNPQGKQMADESMVRNLDAQARAIWPQEGALFRRYALPDEPYILDAGCGTGEISWRLAELFPRARVLGVDIIDDHLKLARSRYQSLAPRLSFEHQ